MKNNGKEVSATGSVYYYNSNGSRHRLDGPAAILWYGGRIWYLKGWVYSKLKHNRLVLFSALEPVRFV